VTFVDSNIPMYLVGASHPHKVDAQRLLEQLIAKDERLVTDAEVLQEILHRYAAIDRRDAIQPAFDAILGVVDEVYAIEVSDVDRAKTVLAGSRTLSARDALHVAVMDRYGVERIMSFDSGFDARPGITRVGAVS
jgi:predicted nucleic acid-binding protein